MEYPSLEKPTAGATRFNTDSSQLEIYDGNQWTGILATSPEQQTGGTRGLFAGGLTPSLVDTIEYINVDSTGDAVDFGNLGAAARGVGGLASRTRGVRCGGYQPGYQNILEYVTISSTGNVTNFGDLSIGAYIPTTFSDATRGVITAMESASPVTNNNIIEYITIASTGNSNDFGDLSANVRVATGCASPTRGLIFSGYTAPGYTTEIKYLTIST